MSMTQTQELFLDDLLPPTFVLGQLDLYNWGPFARRHCAAIDLAGTAIIGHTGSGKTTLVDALMTLVAAQPRYNLASTGGHESDRDLVSYVRGVSGAGREDDSGHIARQGKTVTGIAARFDNGRESLCIGAILALEGSSTAASDLERTWIFSQAPGQGLDEWLEAYHEGGRRGLKQLGRETLGLQIWDSKKAYIAQLRRFFGVGENAFTLLNRAAGLKQLNSIDELFRELVLDDHSAFQRAAEVAGEFDDLAAIHEELETARRQQQTLLPIDDAWRMRQQHQQRLQAEEQVLAGLPIHYAQHGYRLWGERLDELAGQLADNHHGVAELSAQIQRQEGQEQSLRDRYLQSGGSSIELLQQRIGEQQHLCARRQRDARDYQALTRALQLEPGLDSGSFAANQQQVDTLQTRQVAELAERKEQAWSLGASKQQIDETVSRLEEELRQVRARPGSNIPAPFQQFRAELAEHLNLEDSALPFVAELLQVKPEQAQWRGAIERALGGHRLRLIVPPSVLGSALAWINGRDNRLHVRLLEDHSPRQAAQFLADGFSHKVSFKPHACREALKHLLAELDRHCLASSAELERTPHGMTAQGLMSGKAGHFEKQDRTPLQQGWLTGFDNQDRLAELAQQLLEAQQQQKDSVRAYEAARSQAERIEQQLSLLKNLAELCFEDIDLPGAESELTSLAQRLALLTDPASDTAQARQQWEALRQALQSLGQQREDLRVAGGRLEEVRNEATERRQQAFQRIGTGLSDTQQTALQAAFPAPVADQLKRLRDLEEQAIAEQGRRIATLQQRLNDCEKLLVRLMAAAQRVDTGALAEAGQELDDVPAYLQRLKVLSEEALPEKLQRFLDYLNQSSEQGVTQLLSGIDNEVSRIEERIEDINQTMRRVDFQPGRYLRLDPKRDSHESLNTLTQALRVLRSAANKDDQGESHFRALAEMVKLLRDASERKSTAGARALLDPRYRLRFSVSVIERDSGAVIETRTGSQGGSGGEKEIIASYILTASLSYALCPDGSNRPLFGTIVLDEAFSKSSQAVAGRIILALREFGLHPLFVTPNKEMRLLREHTRSAILIHRRGVQASMTSLSWEEIDSLNQRRQLRDENAV
ncbi:ATP-binding protein [Pseudomonas nicosulfuronedens]